MGKHSHLDESESRAGVEVRAKLGELPNYRLPDVSYWRPEIPSGHQAPPSLAVELRSKDQTMAELRRKCEFLRSTGVETCWLIDPVSRTAEIYEGRRKRGSLVSTLRAECLPGFELPPPNCSRSLRRINSRTTIPTVQSTIPRMSLHASNSPTSPAPNVRSPRAATRSSAS